LAEHLQLHDRVEVAGVGLEPVADFLDGGLSHRVVQYVADDAVVVRDPADLLGVPLAHRGEQHPRLHPKQQLALHVEDVTYDPHHLPDRLGRPRRDPGELAFVAEHVEQRWRRISTRRGTELSPTPSST
jgi:hypothetical protein